MSRNYKQINALYWKAVELEATNPMEAKKLYELVEDLEARARRK